MNKELRIPALFARLIIPSKFTFWLMNLFTSALAGFNVKGLDCEQRWIEGPDMGQRLRLRIYRPLNNKREKLPVMLYLHGGGYVLGVPEVANKRIKSFITTRDCVVIAPDYRKSIKHPYPAALNDAYHTLLWIKNNSDTLGVDSEKIIVAGHSAGGGLTAALCLYARDQGEVKISFQLPIYPMIDDRQNLPSAVNNTAPVWNSKSNAIAWDLYLANIKKNHEEVPYYAAPARATNLSNLPPAITFIGDLEPFYDETRIFVENLEKAGIPVAFKIFDDCFHAFETIAPHAKISKMADEFLLSNYADFYDQYL